MSSGDLHDFYGPALMMPAVRLIRCDCGFEASGDGDDELVERAQAHARDVHDMDVPSALVLGLAKARRTEEDGP